jgi:hypothetical protein
MQDEQAHFSPSITGIPWRARPDAVVAGGSRWSSGYGRAEEQYEWNKGVARWVAPEDKDTE